MARRRSESLSWSLKDADPAAIPNARMALALMQCVRRLPGEFPAHSFDDLGDALAPVIELHSRQAKTLIKAYRAARADGDLMSLDADEPDANFLHDRDTLTLLGAGFARSMPRFRPLFDRVERSLADFVDSRAMPADRNVDMLARLVKLSAAEAALLRLAAAACHGTLERSLFNFVKSPARIVRAVEAICEPTVTVPGKLLHSSGALARSGLLDVLNASRSSYDLEDLLRLSAVGETLLGMPHEDEQSMARAVLSPMAPPANTAALHWPHLQVQQTLMKAALKAALEEATTGVNFLLYGGPGTGKTEFVRHLVAEIGASAFVVADADQDGDEATRGERLASLQLSQTFAGHASRAVLVLDEAEDIFQTDYNNPLARLLGRGRESKAWMNALLEKNPHPVIWISNRVSQLDPAYLRRFVYCVEFPATPAAVRTRIARDRLGAIGCSDGLVQSVAAVAEVTPAQLDAAARFAHLCRNAANGADVAVESQIRSHLRAGGHSEPNLRPTPTTRFDMRYLNVAGNATPARVLQSLAQGTTGGSGGAAALLFSGPPGTGKTQLAGEIAMQLGRRLVVRTASDINSKWYGGSEANVARMFRDCDPHDEVLFMDEAEVLLGAREGGTHRADQAVTAEFLRWIEVFQGIFICATNHARSFDAALMRRFTFRLEFLPLNVQQRRAMYAELALGLLSAAANDPPPALDARTDARLARLDGLTPGDFANAARRIRSLALPASAWIDELEVEHGTKPSARSRGIGFL